MILYLYASILPLYTHLIPHLYHHHLSPMRTALLSVILSIPLAATIQPSAPSAIPADLRPLKWGKLNILQTTVCNCAPLTFITVPIISTMYV